jgi:hypothetical protein
MTLHEHVNIGRPGVAWELRRRARASVMATNDAAVAAALFGERVAASTGAGADR